MKDPEKLIYKFLDPERDDEDADQYDQREKGVVDFAIETILDFVGKDNFKNIYKSSIDDILKMGSEEQLYAFGVEIIDKIQEVYNFSFATKVDEDLKTILRFLEFTEIESISFISNILSKHISGFSDLSIIRSKPHVIFIGISENDIYRSIYKEVEKYKNVLIKMFFMDTTYEFLISFVDKLCSKHEENIKYNILNNLSLLKEKKNE